MLDAYGIEVFYNVIKKRVEYNIPGLTSTSDNRDNTSLAHIQSLAALNRFNPAAIPEFVSAIADSNPYNPVLEWIESTPWDGTDRMSEICDTLTVAKDYPQTLRDVLVRKWLYSAVAAASVDGFHGRGVLTLQGSQGLGKTSWVRALVPPKDLCDSVVKVDLALDPSNKDSVLSAITHWIGELGELEGILKKDVARLKAFLTAGNDKVRRPYAKAESEYQRRTVFTATVNEANFLVDPTGNSRFWTIAVKHINFNHGIDMQQVFAQALALVQDGEPWWLSAAEEGLLSKVNDSFRSTSAVRERLLEKLLHKEDPEADAPLKLSTSKVLVVCGVEHPTNQQCKEAAQTLRDFYGEPCGKSGGVQQWLVCFKLTDHHAEL
jgi:putative DNA primase/helicase